MKTKNSESDWYREQTKRWDKLESEGWQFHFPPPQKGHVGLMMVHLKRSSDGIVVSLPNNISQKTIHTRLLEACEQEAKRSDNEN